LALVAQPRSAPSLLAQRPRGARIRAAASGNEEADIAGAVRAALDMVDRTISTASTKEEP